MKSNPLPQMINSAQIFVIIVSRDVRGIEEKLRAFQNLRLPYAVISGEKSNLPHVYYRQPIGKFDALNYGLSLVPSSASLIVLNDADTVVGNFEKGFEWFADRSVGLVHGTIQVTGGPQVLFYRILYGVMRLFGPIIANGEYMIVRKEILDEILPLPPCKAEDSLLAFRVLETGYRVIRDERIKVITTRTLTASKEKDYKRINVCGLYQALSFSSPPTLIRVFYMLLPLISPLLLVGGESGRFWFYGIIEGLVDFLKGDKSGSWQPTYLEQ